MVKSQVIIDGIEYEPKMRKPTCRYPSERCDVCGTFESMVIDSRLKQGYRYRRKKCLQCGNVWRTIEYAYKPQGRPRREHEEWEDSDD